MVDYNRLSNSLKNLNSKQKKNSLDPLRGLSGELRRKVLAALAGHRSGVLTDEELAEMEKIQLDYDLKHRNGV